jgi:NADH-quinone oxidoreductase subunit I
MATRTAPGTGLLKGLGITLKTMLKPASTQQYPHERPVLEPRTRGVIALMDENCTVCMLCARECPDWCIYIDSHKETVPPAKEGGRARTRNVLDRFAIDFALCMYCGICVEVCPFDALWWSPEFEYAEYEIDGLLHEMGRLRQWADTVVPPPPLEEGAEPAAEVTDALEAHRKELAAAEQKRLEAEQAEQAGEDAEDTGPQLREVPDKPTIADIELEGETQVDQATFDELIEQGKSERMARAKAKAAWVKAQKREKLDERLEAWEAEKAEIEQANAEARQAAASDGGGPAADVPDKPTLADMEVEGDPQVDQETFDELVAQGKSERMARAKAKAAWVKARKQELLDEALAEWESKYGEGADSGGGDDAAAEPSAQEPSLGSVKFEGEVEMDQQVYDELIEQGKSERIARAKAKAAYVKAQKQKMLDEDGGEGDQ